MSTTTDQVGLLRSFWGKLHGWGFLGKRDYNKVFGYPDEVDLRFYVQKYQRQDIAVRIVNAPPAATWRVTPTLTGNQSFLTAFEMFAKEWTLWTALERMDRVAGLGQYGLLLLGFNDVHAAEGMARPVRKGSGRKLLYMQPYLQIDARIKKFDMNPGSERFGLPETYEVRTESPARQEDLGGRLGSDTSIFESAMEVHWTRVVHVVEDPIQNEVYGTPRLRAVYNVLNDLLKVSGSSAEAFWLMANRGLQLNVDKEMDLLEEDAKELAAEVEEYQNQLRRVLRTKGVEVKDLGSDVADPRGTYELLIALVAAATGIPKRILIGSESGQLASEQDRVNWADRINERRRNFAWPYVLRPLIERLVDVNILPSPGKRLDAEWPEAFTLTPLERGQEMAQKARAIANLTRQNMHGFPIATQVEAREIVDLPEEPNGELPPPIDPRELNPTVAKIDQEERDREEGEDGDDDDDDENGRDRGTGSDDQDKRPDEDDNDTETRNTPGAGRTSN